LIVAVTRPLPSLDERWVPLITAHHLRSERLTGHRLDTRATADLMKDLKSGKLLCMRRNNETGKCEWVKRTFWNGHEIDVRLGFVQIYRGPRGPYGYDPHSCIEGWLYYVRPDLDPQAEQATESSDAQEPEKLVYIMIRAIAGRLPKGARTTAEVLRRIDKEWDAECVLNEVKPSGFYVKPDRYKVARALGRRSRR
jgi:hypothetical protein